MEQRIIEKMEESINKILDEGLNTNNLDTLYKLSKIKHMAKEDKGMNENYGYGRQRYGENYGEYNERGYGQYNARGYGEYNRRRYRGDDYMERMRGEYGNYEESRKSYNAGNYGAKEDSLKSLEYMLESAVDFFKMLKEEANSQEEINLIRKYTQKISQM